MIKLPHKEKIALLLATVVLVIAAVPVFAHPGLRVSGAFLLRDVSPGKVITHRMVVDTAETDPAMDIVVGIEDLGKYSAKNFITIDNPSFHLAPGESQDVIATINIPSDVGDGGRYAIITIRQKPVKGAGVGAVAGIDVPIVLTIKDSQLLHEGKITEVSLSEAISGQPVNIVITFENTGNHHFKVKAEVSISDARGEILDTIYLPLTVSSVVPGMSGQLRGVFIPKRELPSGVYSVRARAMLDDGTILDEAEGSFEVKGAYLPPSPAGKLTVAPGSASILQTEDGRISASFPKGAVISQVEVSLKSYPLEQLPSPPANFELATTGFRIDGLSGLLAKEATITVKYSQADLERAEADASRLKLARWDEGNNQWSVLKTKVDKEAMTLTTNTTQLSIWAIIVAPPTELHWVVIGGIVGGVIIIALLVFFLAVRRRGY